MPAANTSSSIDTVRLLICDDEPPLRELLTLILSLEPDFEVVAEATTGEEAVAQARTHRPDVVVLDIAMPVMDGLEALPLILQAAPDCRVLMFSGFEEHVLANRAVGASGYLEKGAPAAAIVQAIRGVLDA